jgi:hypothetical protein
VRARLVEYLLVTAFLALAAAGAVALFGDELRGALGLSSAGGSSLDSGPAPRDLRSGSTVPPTPAASP